MQVEASAAKALSDWQAVFSGQTMQRAKRAAEASGTSQVTIADIRQAALHVIAGMREDIKLKVAKDDDRRAA